MKKEDVLADFVKKTKPYFSIAVIPIVMTGVFAIVYFILGYEYFFMWEKYHNPERVVTCIMYFSVASFSLMSTIVQTIIRYKFIRKSDIKHFVLKDDE